MPNTRATTEEAFQHILKNLLNLTPESPLWRALASEDYTSVIDIITMTNEEIDDLTYENDDMKSVSIPTKQKKMLRHILLYHDHQLKIRASKLFEADDWMRVDANTFTTFTATVVPLILRGSASSSMSVTAVGGPTGSITSTQVSAFDYGIKRDVKSYSKFNGTPKLYFRAICQWKGQAHVDNISRIFDLNALIPAENSEDMNLWKRQEAFVMSMLYTNVTGGQAQTIVRQHATTGSAHQVILDLHNHYAAKGNVTALRSDFHRELAMMKLDCNYPGGPTKFLQEFQMLYLDLEESTATVIPDEEKVGQLTAAVSDYPVFSAIVRNMTLIAKQLNAVAKFHDLITELVNKSHELKTPACQANQTKRTGRGSEHGGRGSNIPGRGGLHGRTPGGDIPKTKHSDDLSKGEYDRLSPEQKKALRERRLQRSSNSSERSPGTPATPVSDVNPAPAPAAVTNDDVSTVTQGTTLREIFASRTSRNTNSLTYNENGHEYQIRRLNVHCTVRVSQFELDNVHALIDGGSNNGMSGANMRLVSLNPEESVDVIGCNGNYTFQNMQVGHFHAIVTSTSGERLIGNFYNYVVHGKGKSIISKVQGEAHGLTVYDSACAFGGKQKIILPDGDVFKLYLYGGLLYLPLELPTDAEENSLRHVDFSSPLTWDPDKLSDDLEDAWFANGYDPDAVEDHTFSEIHPYAEILHRDVDLYPSNAQRRERAWISLRPYFGWKPWERIRDTFQVTTQYARMALRLPMRRHFKSRYPALNVRRLDETVATDTFYANATAHDGSTCAQIYVGLKSYFTTCMGMQTDAQFPETLLDFIRTFGAMSKLYSDNAKAEISHAVKDILCLYHISAAQSEPYYQNPNFAERRIQELKAMVTAMMDCTGTPAFLWLLCMTYCCFILNHLLHTRLNGRCPFEAAFGVTPDISVLLIFIWYQHVLYLDPTPHGFPAPKEKSGRFVGIAENIGDALTFYILTDTTNEIIARSDVRPFDDVSDPNVRTALGSSLSPSVDGESIPTAIELLSTVGDNNFKPHFDPLNIIGLTFLRDREVDGTVHRARILEQLPHEGSDSIDDDYLYRIELGDGTREDIMTYRQILEHLERQAESNLNNNSSDEKLWIFVSIEDHQRVDNKWQVLVQWEDGSKTWEPLNVIAKDDPVTVATYANDQGLLDLPGWKRFQQFARSKKKINNLLKQVQNNALSKSRGKIFKFGVEIPRDYLDAQRLDKENGNTLWMDATCRELTQLFEYETFDNCGKNATLPPDYKIIRLHLVYDCKHDYRRKARMVAGGHMTEPPKDSTYSSVVSLRSLRTVMFIGELNQMQMKAADVGNAYLEALTSEKVAFIAGPEFGDKEGHTMIIVRALYGLKSSGARYHDLWANTMDFLGWFPSKADPDVWMKDCGDHCEYLATWVDDLLYIGHNPDRFYKLITDLDFKLKGVQYPTYHLGGDFKRVNEPEPMLTWGSHTFVKKMLLKYEKMFGEPVPKQEVHAPLEPGDHPELDESPLCNDAQILQYQSMIGDFQWAVSLGRMDIYCATVTLSQFRSAPRIGHLNRAKRIYKFLRNYKKTSIKFRTEMPDYSHLSPYKPDFGHVYNSIAEEFDPDTPIARGKPILTTTFVDANLLFDMITGKSATGIIHLLNKTPIDWFCKKQSTIETATYGSEFTALKTAVEQLIALRSELRYFGVPIPGPSIIFCDNKAVVDTSMNASYRLKKRHNILAFHRVRSAIAADICRCYHIEGTQNPADILTKHRSSREWYELMKPLIFWSWRDG